MSPARTPRIIAFLCEWCAYAAADIVIKDIKARPHLGKFGLNFTKPYMAELYGENFEKFLQLKDQYDPEKKFSNEFTRRLFED